MRHRVTSFILLATLPTLASASTELVTASGMEMRIERPGEMGSYRGTRFDWSGMIRSLRVRGHEVYGPWFNRIDPTVYNNVQLTRPDGRGEVVTGIASSGQGPAEEFATDDKALGFDAAAPGGLFLKIGVGILRRPDTAPYDRYRAYQIVDGGRWTTTIGKGEVTFRQTLANKATGYGYVYTKVLRLSGDGPGLVIDHILRNTGSKALVTSVYDHNFFATGRPIDGSYRLTANWPIVAEDVPRPDLVSIDGNVLQMRKPFAPADMAAVWLKGFGSTARDYAFRVEDARSGIGYSVQGDRPLDRVLLWSIWTNVTVESFIRLEARPGGEERWRYTYTYKTP